MEKNYDNEQINDAADLLQEWVEDGRTLDAALVREALVEAGIDTRADQRGAISDWLGERGADSATATALKDAAAAALHPSSLESIRLRNSFAPSATR